MAGCPFKFFSYLTTWFGAQSMIILAFSAVFSSMSCRKVKYKKSFLSTFLTLMNSVAEPHNFYAAPAPGKNFDAAPAPAAPAPARTLLYSKAKFLK
jgi:hypothetical protein